MHQDQYMAVNMLVKWENNFYSRLQIGNWKDLYFFFFILSFGDFYRWGSLNEDVHLLANFVVGFLHLTTKWKRGHFVVGYFVDGCLR